MYSFVSVVIPTFNRVDLLEKQLQATLNQTIADFTYEVIVVNDGSTDQTEALLTNYQQHYSNLIVVHQENSGPAVARNTGVSVAKGPIIAFTDDDTMVSPTWIEEIKMAFHQYKMVALQGKTLTNRSARTPFTHQIENLSYRNLTVTCNAAVLKDAFQQVGGFSTLFPFAHNEDTELTWKLNRIGNIKFVPTVVAYHPPIQKTFWSQLRRMRFLESEFTLFRLHPEAYKLYRNASPWITILFEVAFFHFLRNLKFSLGFYKRPWLMLKGLVLNLASELYLFALIPSFFLKQIKTSQS
jgi:glycosyltransferase involved in cell wall biosynthesis